MPRRTTNADASDQDDVYRCLAHYRRRRILALLAERDSPVSETELADRIAAAESSAADDSETAIEPLRVELRHVHLPKLSEAGFVDWDRDGNTVARADHPSLRDGDVAAHLDRLDESWDPFVSALAHRHRRLVLSVASRRESVDVDQLASAVVEREGSAAVSEKRVRTSLHHTHLPSLDDAGLVEYDRDEGTVSFLGHPEIEDDWFASEVNDLTDVGPALAHAPL